MDLKEARQRVTKVMNVCLLEGDWYSARGLNWNEERGVIELVKLDGTTMDVDPKDIRAVYMSSEYEATH